MNEAFMNNVDASKVCKNSADTNKAHNHEANLSEARQNKVHKARPNKVLKAYKARKNEAYKNSVRKMKCANVF